MLSQNKAQPLVAWQRLSVKTASLTKGIFLLKGLGRTVCSAVAFINNNPEKKEIKPAYLQQSEDTGQGGGKEKSVL